MLFYYSVLWLLLSTITPYSKWAATMRSRKEISSDIKCIRKSHYRHRNDRQIRCFFSRCYFWPFWRQTHLYNTANFWANKIELWKAVRIQPWMPRLILQSKPTPLASKRADLMHEQENGTWHEICMIYERPKGSRHQLKERFFRFVMWFKFFLEYSNKTRKKGFPQSRKVTPSSPFLLIMGVFHVIFSWYLCLRQIMLQRVVRWETLGTRLAVSVNSRKERWSTFRWGHRSRCQASLSGKMPKFQVDSYRKDRALYSVP